MIVRPDLTGSMGSLHRLLLCTVFLLMSMIPVGCPGKGTGPKMTLTISPSGVVGVPDEDVQFSVETDPVITIVSYAWTFSGGATPSTSSSATPTVTLGDPGTYSVGLTISDGTNMQLGNASFTVAGVPVITAVTPSGEVGLPSGEVQFTALTEWPNVTEWHWTFNSGEEFESESEEAAPILQLPNPGTYSGTVVATNDIGAATSTFEYTVATPVEPTWTVQELGQCMGSDQQSRHWPHSRVTGLVFEGKVALAYTAPGGLTLRRALVALPEEPADWEEHVIDPEGFVAGAYSMTLHKGRLAILYQQHFGTPDSPRDDVRLCFAWADPIEPTSTEDWQIHEIKAASSQGLHSASLSSIDDEYLLGTREGPGLAIFVSSESPESAEDWTIYFLKVPFPGGYVSEGVGRIVQRDGSIATLASVYGPMESVSEHALFYRTTISPPMIREDWNAKILKGSSGIGGSVDLWPHGAGWGMVASDDTGKGVTLSTTPIADPTHDDWTVMSLEADSVATFNPAVGIGAGRAAIAYFDDTNQRLRLARQVTSQIDLTQDWQRTTVTGVIGNENRFWVEPLVLEVEGRIAIFWCEPATQRLRSAFADGVY